MSENGTPGFERRTVLKTAGALGAFAGIAGVTSASGDTKELLVGKSNDVGMANAKANVESALPTEARVVKENETLGYVKVEIPESDGVGTMEDAITSLENATGIEYAEENARYYTLGFDNDDPSFDQQYAPQQVDAPEAWNTTLGSDDVTIAIIDQGVDYEHPNLEARFGDYKGEDFVDGNPSPMPVTDSENHGTHVAGIAAATTDNGEGTAGVSNCRLLSGRALGADGGGSLEDIADAIQWAADEGADVINMSLGGGGANQTMENAIDYALGEGSLPIAAAGNDGGSVSYPAAYDNCMAVSAVDESENLANFSNFGPEINVTAGGVDVLSTVNNGQYDEFSGTSMSSPVAAGVAGLGKSAFPNLSADELWDRLEETATDVQGLSEDEQGEGLVNAANIVEDGDDDDDDDDDDDPGEGECGDETNTASAEGELSGGWWGNPSDEYTYELQTADPCFGTVTLDGPSDATFDLYLTLDGRTPTTTDYDERSYNWGADEEIQVDLDGDETFGILVDRYDGSGSYTLTVEELGK